MRRYAGDNVKLFSIHVSNVLEGVASACRACALVPDAARRADSSCVPCPPGFYIHAETNRCQECPPGTHLAGRHTYGREACVPCGPASVSNRVSDFVLPKNGPARKSGKRRASLVLQEHSRCYSDCSFSRLRGNRTLTYDLAALSEVTSLTLEPSFTTKGTKYLHLFNISLCGHQVSSRRLSLPLGRLAFGSFLTSVCAGPQGGGVQEQPDRLGQRVQQRGARHRRRRPAG